MGLKLKLLLGPHEDLQGNTRAALFLAVSTFVLINSSRLRNLFTR